MSTARKHFCTDVRRDAGGGSSPRKNGLNGCIPAVVSSTEGSSVGGTSEAEGTSMWPRSTKCSTKERRIAAESIAKEAIGGGTPRGPAGGGACPPPPPAPRE